MMISCFMRRTIVLEGVVGGFWKRAEEDISPARLATCFWHNHILAQFDALGGAIRLQRCR